MHVYRSYHSRTTQVYRPVTGLFTEFINLQYDYSDNITQPLQYRIDHLTVSSLNHQKFIFCTQNTVVLKYIYVHVYVIYLALEGSNLKHDYARKDRTLSMQLQMHISPLSELCTPPLSRDLSLNLRQSVSSEETTKHTSLLPGQLICFLMFLLSFMYIVCL